MMTYTFQYRGESDAGAFFVWEYNKRGERSQLCIKKSHVPQPVPNTIEMGVFSDHAVPNINKKSTNKPIQINFLPICEHTTTYRYDCKDRKGPINSVYIPKSMLRDIGYPSSLTVVIEWNEEKVPVAPKPSDDLALIKAKAKYLLNEVVRQDVQLIDIWHIEGDLFMIDYEYDKEKIDPIDCSQVYRVLELEGSISGVKFVAWREE